VQIFYRLPHVVAVWVPFPLDQVLKSTPLPEEAMVYDGLDFVFRVFINKIWGWSRVIGAVSRGFLEGGQQGGMEDVMDSP